MNFENIMLSERCQTQRATYYMIPFVMKYPEQANPQRQKIYNGCTGLEIWGEWECSKIVPHCKYP